MFDQAEQEDTRQDANLQIHSTQGTSRVLPEVSTKREEAVDAAYSRGPGCSCPSSSPVTTSAASSPSSSSAT